MTKAKTNILNKYFIIKGILSTNKISYMKDVIYTIYIDLHVLMSDNDAHFSQ